MGIKVNFILFVKLLLLALASQVTAAYGESEEESHQVSEAQHMQKTNLQDKFYRQALYHYFQDDPNQALSQVERSKAKLIKLDSRSALFEAGLQLSAGLLQQAKMTLVNFDVLLDAEQVNSEDQSEKNINKSAKANELRLIALLSLTNQYLSQGNIIQAQDTLAKIKSVPATYYQEYHVLNQLAYWPEQNDTLFAKPEAIGNESSPYIQLNDALRLIELAKVGEDNYDLAIKALNTIKVTKWHEGKANFWKTLFIDEAIYSSKNNQKEMTAIQNQAIQDYAQLLLAQIYISQEQYSSAFNELKTFPEQSPYAESALFLFAFASQQVEQNKIAFSLLNLLYKNYPYSPLGWQSAELMAQQVTEQRSNAQGISAYQDVESFFIERQQNLTAFSVVFNKSTNLLNFSPSDLSAQSGLKKNRDYLPRSIWLQQALMDAELASLYQHLQSIDEQTDQLKSLLDKTVWLAEIISLNQQRKQKIITAQEAQDKQELFSQLKSQRDSLAALLAKELTNVQSAAFANEVEREWITRVTRSHHALQNIGDKRDTKEYEERLTRVGGVLAWQLASQYPERAWYYKKQLQQLDRAITGVIAQKKKIVKISNTQGSLELKISKHSQSVIQLKLLLTQLAQLREKVSVSIRKKVNIYIDGQHITLAEHLLSTRQEMAKVLEDLASADKRLSLKLTLSNKRAISEKLSQATNNDATEKPSAMAGSQ